MLTLSSHSLQGVNAPFLLESLACIYHSCCALQLQTHSVPPNFYNGATPSRIFFHITNPLMVVT